ncbi:PHD finger protein 20-like protein 1 isoform X1 [Pleurodeles waltl]|uniref:PHD finger protein 20-like protein 1 isoform X1 n=1 Tax=Pleurodeles waltl TaxID=8319 RepID=UPI003709A672
MSKKPPSCPGIEFEVGARLEAQDYLQKWYPSRIEKIDYEEGKMLVHFERWSHRYDEWIFWDSSRLRPLERPALRKEGLKDEEELFDFKPGEEVLARWTDCRYYPAKIEAMSPEGTYTVQFYDGVIRCLKRMHIKSMPDDARGQDWIALVKAAAAAVALKGKAGGKPRTSANSNKDKEEKKSLKVALPKEQTSVSKTLEDVLKKEEESTSRGIMDVPVVDVPKITLPQTDASISVKRKTNDGSSFQAKRARLNKITGLLASKAVVVDDVRKECNKAPSLGQIPSANTQSQKSNEAATLNSVSGPKTTALSPALSSKKVRSRKAKYESRDPLGSKEPSCRPPLPLLAQSQELLRVPPLPPPVINETSTPQPMNLSRSLGRNHRRRRSRRLDTSLLQDDSLGKNASPSSVIGGKELISNPQSQRELSVPEAPQVSPLSLEKFVPCLPLDLSRSAEVQAPLVPVFPKEYIHAEMEDVLTLTSNAVTDGRTASTAQVMNSKRTECVKSPKEPLVDLDHNKFKCSVPACSKAFRKAKLLDYHVKYYHSAEKETEPEPETVSPERIMRTRATSATVPASTLEHLEDKRQRTVSTSSSPLSQVSALRLELPLNNNLKLPKVSKKKRSSASMSSDGTDATIPVSVKEKTVENLQEKMSKKVIEKDKHSEVGIVKTEKKVKLEEKISTSLGKKKDKERKEKKDKDHLKSKQKKKKKKKKKSKLHEHTECDGNPLNVLERCPSPLSQSFGDSLPLKNMFTVKNTANQFPRAIISVDLSGENLSDVQFLDNSSTESLLLSGDEYNQDFDSTNFEESQDEEDAINEIVRCVCEMDEEKGFMIQCEECLCWQHNICMGLIEDSIPEHYLCYVCRDPPGQRWSAKYRFDKDWLNNGRMCGLSFLNENYSHLNAKKIVSTHHLLADVYGVTEILHGLQLRIEILKNKQHPDLHLWACPGKYKQHDCVSLGAEKTVVSQDSEVFPDRTPHGPSNKETTCLSQKMEENYITSEHSYQKPQSFSQQHTSVKVQISSEDDDASSLDEEDQIINSAIGNISKYSLKTDGIGELNSTEKNTVFILSEKREADEQVDSRLQWQLNLLTHVENVQNEITSRMDLIEKEVDVLESWLDFTGELEPPDPLARLPQLKRRIKQLLQDMGKVQQIATLCTV